LHLPLAGAERMRAFWAGLILLLVVLCVSVGCSHCPIHRALFGSDEEEAVEAGDETAMAPSSPEGGLHLVADASR
jgi:hypothetical protein